MIRNENEITITDEEAKTCLLDGKKFDSSKKMIWYVRKIYGLNFEQYILKAYYNNIRPVCLKTGKPLSFKASKLGPFFHNFTKNCFPRKPHTEETKQKIKEGCEKTSMEKFGVKNVFSTDWCKEKSRKTLLEKYGVENIMKTNSTRELFSTFVKSSECIEKTKQTNIKKYGESRYTITNECKLKIRKYNYNLHYKNWSDYINKLKSLRMICLGNENDIINLNLLKFKCILCNNKWNDTLLIPFCKKCEETYKNARSKEESSLMKWLKETTKLNFTPNKRFNINGKIYEGDICFEDKKIIIELNGLFWHSEMGGLKDKKYHIEKLKCFESIGYNVIQIFEDEWLFKTDIVKNKILHKLGENNNLQKIYARKCIVKKIDNPTANLFLEKTHSQGKANALYCYGAYYDDELVAVMTFSLLRIALGNKNKKENEYEMLRFSTTEKYRIVGIAGKLLSCFVNEIKPVKIISYADRRWTNRNNVYEKIGFKFVDETKPNYWYIKKYKREHRFNFTKQKLVRLGHDRNKTEWQIMQELGYDRIWDCGHLKYEWRDDF